MRAAGLLVAVAMVACAPSGADRVIVAAGTTLVDSGFIEALASEYEATHADVQLSVVGEASARVLNLGESGAAEVLITHAPALELAFRADHDPELFEVSFTSEFHLVGPSDFVRRLDGLSFGSAFAEISAQEWPFVTRGDGSGTNEVELSIWDSVGIEPSGDWYASTGQGMGLTLQVADQRQGFTLAEAGAFANVSGFLDIESATLTDSMVNPYRIIVIGGADPAAEAFAQWTLSAQGQAAIRKVNGELFGAMIYTPGI